MDTTHAPLQHFRCVGIVTKTWQPTPDSPAQPAGTCRHCGQGILYCVLAQATADTDLFGEPIAKGEVIDVGTTCAERIGLSATEVKEHLAALYADQREADRISRSKAYRDRVALADVVAALLGQPHGTAARYLAGCYCPDCLTAAPHGTPVRFANGECLCGPCLDWAFADGWVERDRDVLIDLETGQEAPARLVDGKFGRVWCVKAHRDDEPTWVNPSPKRRSTIARKGYTEAEVPFIGRQGRNGFWPAARLAEPIADNWGEPIARKGA